MGELRLDLAHCEICAKRPLPSLCRSGHLAGMDLLSTFFAHGGAFIDAVGSDEKSKDPASIEQVDQISPAKMTLLGPAKGIIVRPSPLHGNGVFAMQDFRKGDIIELSPSLPLRLAEAQALGLQDYGFHGNFVDADITCIMLGHGSLFNHADEPNVVWDKVPIRSRRRSEPVDICHYFAAHR